MLLVWFFIIINFLCGGLACAKDSDRDDLNQVPPGSPRSVIVVFGSVPGEKDSGVPDVTPTLRGLLGLDTMGNFCDTKDPAREPYPGVVGVTANLFSINPAGITKAARDKRIAQWAARAVELAEQRRAKCNATPSPQESSNAVPFKRATAHKLTPGEKLFFRLLRETQSAPKGGQRFPTLRMVRDTEKLVRMLLRRATYLDSQGQQTFLQNNAPVVAAIYGGMARFYAQQRGLRLFHVDLKGIPHKIESAPCKR